MQEEYIKWYSPNLSRDFDMLTFGHAGQPVILFPTSKGRYYENKDFKLIDAVADYVDSGRIKIYCPDGIDEWSWYSKDIHPADRVKNHMWYDKMLNDEVVSRARHETGYGKVATAGCSFGGYHAANFAFRHPWLVNHMFSLSGAFDITGQLDGFYNDDVYYNNPVDFLPNDNHPGLWEMNIVLGTTDQDICRGYNEHLSEILSRKAINHWLDMRENALHDWPIWRTMFRDYVSIFL